MQRSVITYLFQVGVDPKLVTEFICHISDAVDKYQITSNEQRENISKVIRGYNDTSKVMKSLEEQDPSLEVVVTEN